MNKNKSIKNISQIIHVVRHGARTSSSIGRKEDSQLSIIRKGITPVGLFQFYQLGRECINCNSDLESRNLFQECLENNRVNIITSEKSRVLDSAQAFIKGVYSENNKELENKDFISVKENKFAENLLDTSKYDCNNKYKNIIEKFSPFINGFHINTKQENKINLRVDKLVFNKKIHFKHNKMIEDKYSLFEYEQGHIYSKYLTPYLKKLFLHDLPIGIYDFNLDQYIDHDYFNSNNILTMNQIKRLIDFIRCNKFYEDIPIYNSEYKEFVNILKKFLINYYHYSTTIEDEVNLLRLSHFFIELCNIVEDEEKSFNVFINHNTALRTVIKFMMKYEQYQVLLDQKDIIDEDFFTISPKFAGKYTFKKRKDKKLIFEANDKNITHLLRSEFIDNERGEYLINFDDFKKYLIFIKDKYKI